MLRALAVSRRASGLLTSFTSAGEQLSKLESFRRLLSTSTILRHERLHEVLPPLESFSRRHIGPSEEEVAEMLRACGVEVGRHNTLL